MKLIFLGPPGAGKGTQADMATEKFHIPKISTGDLLREAVKSGTVLGKKAKTFMDSGALVPDELVISLLKERLAKNDCKNGFILDGFPRNLAQAEKLEREKIIVEKAINFDVSIKSVVDRISSRWTCKNCDAVFNTKTMPPKKKGKCNKCQGELYQRDDQKPEAVKTRMEVYNEKTRPLIDYYAKKKILVNIDAEPPADMIFKDVIKALKK